MDGPECKSDGNATALHTIPGSQPEEQVKKDAGDPVLSIIRAKEIDVSSRDGVAGSGFDTKLVCEGGKGKIHRGGGAEVAVVTDCAKDGEAVCDDRIAGLGLRGEKLGVERVMSDVSFKLS